MQKINLSGFYKSRTRKNRFGNDCIICKKIIVERSDCMRKELGYNSFGCMQYMTSHLICYEKQKSKEAPIPNYKKAYYLLIEYFDQIPEDEKEKVNQELIKCNV